MELTMKELIESKWQEILNILVKEHEISEVAVNTWIQPLTIQTISDDSITFFMVRGPRGIEFIKHKYYDIYLSMAIEQVTGKQFKILFTDSNSAAPKSEPKKVSVPAEYIGNLNPRYTFDTFVVGPTNKWLMLFPLQSPNHLVVHTILSFYMEELDLERRI